MKRKKIPALALVAKDEADEKKQEKAKGLLASLGALLGIGAASPSAKMTKRTLTTKRVEMEESDDEDSSAEEEEEEEERSESDIDSEHSESSAAEEEEEEEEERGESEEEEERSAKGKHAKYEEEEEEEAKGLASALRAAYKSPKVKAAFLAAIPEHLRASASLRTPDRLFREVRRATGAKTLDGAMTALSRQRAKAAGASAKTIRGLAKVEARLANVERTTLEQKVSAMVAEAKSAGKAPTKALRDQLRAHGAAHGTKALAKLIDSLPEVAPVREKIPAADASTGAPIGAPERGVQAEMMAQMTAGMTPEQAKAFEADFNKRLTNGAAHTPRS